MKTILLNSIGICTSSIQCTHGFWWGPLKVNHNHNLIINCKFMQNTTWTCNKFVVIIAICYLSRELIMCNRQINASHSLGITPKDRKRRYIRFLEERTSNTTSGTLDSEKNSKHLLKEEIPEVTWWTIAKNFNDLLKEEMLGVTTIESICLILNHVLYHRCGKWILSNLYGHTRLY